MGTYTEQEITDYINDSRSLRHRACAISSLRDLVIENINLKFKLAELKQEVADLKAKIEWSDAHPAYDPR